MEWSRKWFEGFRGVLREGVPLAPLSHLRVGGRAALFVEPWAEEDAAMVVRVCCEHGLPLRVLGGGSNLLIADEGVDAVVVYLGQWKRVVGDEQRLIASAGAGLPTLMRMAKERKLAGLETLAGIPAQVGGAVSMNAGTKHGETFDHLVGLRVIDESGEIVELGVEDFAPKYRDGGLAGAIVTTATFELVPDDPQAILARMTDYLRERNANQPVTERSVGCIFKNPTDRSAGMLIDRAGMKGERAGDVQVSEKHANFFVNRGKATCAQVLELVERVRERVRAETGVVLELEVRLWGM